MSTTIHTRFHQTLNQLLSDGDEADRCYAARTAGEAGMVQLLPVLQDCLYHEDPDVSIDAADALAKVGPAVAEPAELVARLIEMVNLHPEGDARVAAARALARLDHPDARQALLNWAQGNPGQGEVAADWDDWWDIQLNAIQALGQQGRADAVPVLEALLTEEILDIEADLLRALVHCGEAGLASTLAQLQSPSPRLVRRAVRALRFVECDASLIALFRQIRHPDASVRAAVAEVLGQREARRYFIDLVELLRDPADEVRSQALKSAESMLAQLESYHLKHITPQKLTGLLDMLDADGRALILTALMRLLKAEPEADPALSQALSQALLNALQSDHGGELEAAAGLLVQLPVAEAQPIVLARLQDTELALRSRRVLVNTVQQVGQNHRDFIRPLNTLLQEEDNAALRQVVMEALSTLALLPPQHEGLCASQVLAHYLAGEELNSGLLDAPAPQPMADDSRISCVMVDDAGTPQGPASTLHAAESEEATIRALMAQFSDGPVEAAAEAEPALAKPAQPQSTLAAISQANVQAALQQPTPQAQDQAEHLREMVAELPEALDSFGNIVVGHLDQGEQLKLSRKKIARLPDYSNQVLAVRALGKQPTAASVSQLLGLLLETEPVLVREVVSSLAQIAARQPELSELNNALGPLATLLLAGTPEIRQLCARTLGLMQHRGALPVLKQALQDGDSNVRIEAIYALARLVGQPLETQDEARVVLHKPAPASVQTAVAHCLADPLDGVVLAAISFVSQQGMADRVPQLIQLGLNNSALTAAAGQALARLEPQAAATQLLEPMLEADFASQRPHALQMMTVLAPAL